MIEVPPASVYKTQSDADKAAMAKYRREWKKDIKKRPLADLIGEKKWFENLVIKYPHHIDEDDKILEELHHLIAQKVNRVVSDSERDCPIAFFIPSFHQAQILNAWMPGLDPSAPEGFRSVCDFSAIRGGKTCATVIDLLMWCVPNQADWLMFEPYEDDRKRIVQVHRRPNWDYWKRTGKMTFSDDEPPKAGPVDAWQGCVDENHWHDKIEKEHYKRWMPKKWVKKSGKELVWMKADKYFETQWDFRVTAKLYESKNDAWSGKELFQINLDEGVPRDKLDEARTRTHYFRWSYTPRDAANNSENARVAYDVYKNKPELMLPGNVKHIIFDMDDAPEHVMPDKNERLKIGRAMGAKGKPVVDGGFFQSSPAVFDNFKPERHILPVDAFMVRRAIKGESHNDELSKFPFLRQFFRANIFRGFDEGLAHPTACCWFCLLQTGEFVAFQEYEETDTSIQRRADQIIELSGNKKEMIQRMTGAPIGHRRHEQMLEYARSGALSADVQRERATGTKITRYKEVMTGMFIRRTYADSKIFRRDPNHPLDNWVENYARAGLRMERAPNNGPAERCDYVNGMLLPDHTRKHLNASQFDPDHSYGHALYITINCVNLRERLENYLWQQFQTGSRKGEFTGKPEERGDDLIDSFCYPLVAKPRWVPPEELQARMGAMAA